MLGNKSEIGALNFVRADQPTCQGLFSIPQTHKKSTYIAESPYVTGWVPSTQQGTWSTSSGIAGTGSLPTPQKVEEAFKVGDVVMLKSGGPKMTVTDWWTDQGRKRATCSWYCEGKEFVEHTFGAETLILVEDDEDEFENCSYDNTSEAPYDILERENKFGYDLEELLAAMNEGLSKFFPLSSEANYDLVHAMAKEILKIDPEVLLLNDSTFQESVVRNTEFELDSTFYTNGKNFDDKKGFGLICKYDNTNEDKMFLVHELVRMTVQTTVGRNYAAMGVKVISTNKEGKGMIEVNVPNDLLDKMMTSKLGLLNKVNHHQASNQRSIENGEGDDIVPKFEEIVSKAAQSRSELIPTEKRMALEHSGLPQDANESDVAEWLSFMFLKYNPIKMAMNTETYSKLFKLFDGSFDEEGNLWGVKTEVDWSDDCRYVDYEIIFTSERN